jgi:hypothetical protein
VKLATGPDQRIHTRFDKLFQVIVASELFGESRAIARNISIGGMLVEMTCPLPLGAVVTIHFQVQREDKTIDEIVARAEVKHHYCLNYAAPDGDEHAARAIGLRFLDFDDRPGLELTWSRWLH